VNSHLDGALDPAAAQARRAIHDNDVERLKQLLAESPALPSCAPATMTAACWEWPPAPSATAVQRRQPPARSQAFEFACTNTTTWNSHEPASLLHELVFHANYDAMRFLIDRGIDMTIKDYRWNGTAQGWARYAAKDEPMAQWLKEAEGQRRR